LKSSKNHTITSTKILTSDKTFQGDIIIEKGYSLTFKISNIKSNNIIIPSGATLNIENSSLISNYANSNEHFFNTNIILKPQAKLKISNSALLNFDIDAMPNSKLEISGRKATVLMKSKINVGDNVDYLQKRKTTIELIDKSCNIIFKNEIKNTNKNYVKSIEEIRFTGNGSVKLLNQ